MFDKILNKIDFYQGGEDLFNKEGMPRGEFPNHWRGENGLYAAGFARRGLHGISMDAKNIARDINLSLQNHHQKYINIE